MGRVLRRLSLEEEVADRNRSKGERRARRRSKCLRGAVIGVTVFLVVMTSVCLIYNIVITLNLQETNLHLIELEGEVEEGKEGLSSISSDMNELGEKLKKVE